MKRLHLLWLLCCGMLAGGSPAWAGLPGAPPATQVAASSGAFTATGVSPVAMARGDGSAALQGTDRAAAPATVPATASLPIVQVLHNDFVSAAKFTTLQGIASRQGVSLQHQDVNRAVPQAMQDAVATASFIVLDVPRPTDRAAVAQRVEPALKGYQGPVLTVGSGQPAWEGMTPQYAALLAGLYAAGGESNFSQFFALVNALHEGRTPGPDLLVAPRQLLATGFYHPDAPRIFDSLGDYLAWYASIPSAQAVNHVPPHAHAPAPVPGQVPDPGQAHPQARPLPSASAGRVALLMPRSVVADMVTGEMDALIRRCEQAGLLPVALWADASAPEGLAGVLGHNRIDVLVNLTHLQNGAARSRDFLALDVPVIQTLRFREGDAKDWPGAKSGVAARTTAVFLAGPEGWGMSDPIVLSAGTGGVTALLPEQADALIAKLRSLVALRHTSPADKKLALMFWNYPAGEKNLGASNLNIPRSIVSIQAALAAQGYQVGSPVSEAQVIATGQRMLGALYGSLPLDQLLKEGLAGLYPLADYEQWLSRLPRERQAQLRHAGDPGGHWAVREINGKRYFVIPRWPLGNLLVMPQIPRDRSGYAHYHDTASAPDHLYMAAYLYVRQLYPAHALIHLGTHGTQEWLPGKDRGLAASDFPWLAVGSMPVFYPYIQDNVGEAIQARRRGRAVIISHQTPPFAPAGLYDQLRDLHHLIHEYLQLDEGGVREQSRAQIISAAVADHLNEDIGWTEQDAQLDFDGFLQQLHDHLHDLARTAMPLGLHTFGQPASVEHRASTIMQQLGKPLYAALGMPPDESLAADYAALTSNPAYMAVRRILDADADHPVPTMLKDFADRVRELDQRLRDTQENEALLAGLAGRFVAPGAGGDPIRNPDTRSGRNLYAFEADKIPARAAYESAAQAYAQLTQAFRDAHNGAWPRKLAFSLWASETVRHLGVTEAQILHALGLRPVWDAGGRVTRLDIIPTHELGHPRSDVVVQVTGVYRDQFDGFMRLLDDALQRLDALDEPDNPIAGNSRRIAGLLQAEGLPTQDAQAAARHRIFSSAPGEYGTGVPHQALQSADWEDDAVLARQFLTSSRYAYGVQGWGDTPAHANLLAEQLRGTQAAVMARSSNLHGVLSTDHPFEFLGGLSAAVRLLDGQAPQLLISDLRGSDVKTTGLSRFLADELRVRYLNPHWVGAMQQEGYAGTLQVLNATNNLFGWQVMDPSTVRGDQWQALFDTYVTDTRGLGTRVWFEQSNPTAQAQMLERMAEAIRKGYWDAPEQTRRDLAQRWQELADQFDVHTGAEVTRRFIAAMAQGFGLTPGPAPDADAVAASTDMPENAPAEHTSAEAVQGQVLQPVARPASDDTLYWWGLAAILLLICGGGAWQARNGTRPRRFTP